MSLHHNHDCCDHQTSNASVFQTLDEMDFERGLWGAALYGDVPKIMSLFKQGKDPNGTDQSGYTPLHYAARNGHLKACEALLDFEADVNAQTRCGHTTPLHRAVYMGHMQVVMLLIGNNKCSLDIQDSDGKTCLHKAVEQKHWNIAELLLKHCPQLKHISDNNNKNPFCFIDDVDIDILTRLSNI